jgi:hypothetical protein
MVQITPFGTIRTKMFLLWCIQGIKSYLLAKYHAPQIIVKILEKSRRYEKSF